MGITSEFRELVSIPTASFRSMSNVLVPGLAASCRAIANPTAPPPITCQLLLSAKDTDLIHLEAWGIILHE
jgi:hypothetical protein